MALLCVGMATAAVVKVIAMLKGAPFTHSAPPTSAKLTITCEDGHQANYETQQLNRRLAITIVSHLLYMDIYWSKAGIRTTRTRRTIIPLERGREGMLQTYVNASGDGKIGGRLWRDDCWFQTSTVSWGVTSIWLRKMWIPGLKVTLKTDARSCVLRFRLPVLLQLRDWTATWFSAHSHTINIQKTRKFGMPFGKYEYFTTFV